jgi:hypothetical protein
LSERHDHLRRFLVENPYSGLIEIMDKTGLTSEPVLDQIGYYKLPQSLKEEVYAGEMDLYQVWCLNILEPETQERFWKDHRNLDPKEFRNRAAEMRRWQRAVKFVEDFGSGPEAIAKVAEIGEEEAGRIFRRMMELYPGLRKMLKQEQSDVDL